MQTNTFHAPLAIAGGVVAAGGATALLVKDAMTTGLTVEIALMPVLVGLTILCGHLLWSAIRAWRLLSAAGLLLLTLMGSGLTIYETMGRRAASRDLGVAVATQSVETLARTVSDHTRTKALVVEAQGWVGSECKSGAGTRCQGVTFILNQRAASLAALETKLAGARPAPAADPKAERVAALASLAAGYDPAHVKLAVATFEPFAFPLFLELAAMVLFGYGSRGRHPLPPMAQAAGIGSGMGMAPTAIVAITEENRDITDAEIDELKRLLQLARQPLTNNQVAQQLSISKGEASKRVTRLVQSGIVTREKDGRNVAIQLSGTVH